jgi:hypothetical protein
MSELTSKEKAKKYLDLADEVDPVDFFDTYPEVFEAYQQGLDNAAENYIEILSVDEGRDFIAYEYKEKILTDERTSLPDEFKEIAFEMILDDIELNGWSENDGYKAGSFKHAERNLPRKTNKTGKGLQSYWQYWEEQFDELTEEQAELADGSAWSENCDEYLNIVLKGESEKYLGQLGFYEANDVDDDGFVFKVFEGEVFIELDVPFNKNEIDDFEEKALELLGIDEDWIISIN